ncbi:hexose-6-phosphate:phosphate antiporter [Staphylococcus aureus]|uniref:hexose-6-phosphate:phosphate antiporter n=1 Tax=Staphylococcus aureus TaxID=1280 RepID=UPI002174DFA7|nr:hexose-6-phosphate:phosphate antiporter [Staphylococcus aureus]MCS4837495.1 hexose-6-phosphate:phosphate antiporter [Staphylococcus aureus]MCZ4933414.1 hexose-6-phosphate:phosphate antiporter [Staphylococcus aureus]
MNFFDIHKIPNKGIPLSVQRKLWLRNFMQAFFVVFFVYMAMYLIRNNFKAAQPFLKEEIGLSTLELGYIGLAFSITYGLGKTLLGYFVDGRNTKRIISFLLILSAITVLIMGFVLSYFGSVMGLLIVLWGLNGVFQSVGGPASYSTISRWAPRTKRGRYLGFWNTSHNIGGAIAGGVALWGANVFFHGNVIGMFIFPSVIALLIGIATLFIGKDDPEELGWNRAEEIWEEPVDKENIDSQGMTKWEIFKKYILGNPVIWILCVSNVFVYIVRIGIDNWAPLYVSEHLHFSKGDAVNTIFYFEIGALVALIFGPQLLIGVSLTGFVPKNAISVANGMTGSFAYLFGDSMAKVGLAAIADPTRNGLNIFGYTLSGWTDVFIVFYVALFLGMILLGIVAFYEEKKIRSLKI